MHTGYNLLIAIFLGYLEPDGWLHARRIEDAV
jgi:hypothetical protein